MRALTLLVAILLSTSSFFYTQDVFNYFFDEYMNWPAGNGNVVYDAKSEHYFFAELDRDINYSGNSAIHIKKVDKLGNLIESKYFITDFDPYSGHYISSISIQGPDLVLFLNRNMGYPHIHDSMIIRIHKNLQDSNAMTRFYRAIDSDTPLFNSVKINESVAFGNKVLFIGSVFTRGDMNNQADNSRLLVGVIDKFENITYHIFKDESHDLEGLSILGKPKEGSIYIGCRNFCFDCDSKPQMIKFSLNDVELELKWSRIYPDLRIDQTDYTSYNKGVEMPIVSKFDTYDFPGFFTRDVNYENICLTLFDPSDGSPLFNTGLKFEFNEDVELVDAIRYDKYTTDGFAVLLTHKEPYNDWNTNSFVFSCTNTFNSNLSSPKYQNLSDASEVHSTLGRRFLKSSGTTLSIGIHGNTPEMTSEDFHRAILFQSEDLNFQCIGAQKGIKPEYMLIEDQVREVYLDDIAIILQDRTIEFPLDLPNTTTVICEEDDDFPTKNTIKSKDVSVYPNPATSYTQISIPENNDNEFYSFKLINASGQTVLMDTLIDITTRIETDKFSKGLYIIQILKNGDILNTERFLIQ